MKKKNQAWSILSKIMMGLTLLFFYLPIFYIILFSFNGKKSLQVHSGISLENGFSLDGFSLKWYEKVFNPDSVTDYLGSISTTVSIAIWATIISTILGTITAIGLSKSGKVIRTSVERINELPIMNPDIVTGISLLMLFSAFTFIEKGWTTMLLAHIMFCTPFVILSIMPKLRTLDPNLIDAAMDLGCTPFQAMYKVIIPQIIPSIIAGALIAFTMSFDDFVISYFVKGVGTNNISTLVYSLSSRTDPSIYALSTLIIVMITVMLILANIIPMIHGKIKKIKNKHEA